MKLAGLLVALAISGGIYYFYFKKMPTTDAGTSATQSISLTGVRMDLLQIARAERTYMASNGKCGALDDLTSSGTMNLARTERDGYSYEIRCGSTSQFAIVASHAAAPADSGTRYPTLSIDETLQITEIH
jgi:hypothetical protein